MPWYDLLWVIFAWSIIGGFILVMLCCREGTGAISMNMDGHL